jgi:serine/threonine-protein kinase HipA
MAASSRVPDQLIVLLQGRMAGELQRHSRSSSYDFVYDDRWRDDRAALPLSLSMPLAGRSYRGDVVTYYLRALLPDSEARLNAIAFQFGVSPDDPFALLAYTGEDCAGAVQLVRPDRLDEVVGAGPGTVNWLSEADVAEALRELSDGTSTGPHAVATGQFSLPGALPKIALTLDPRRNRWGVPSGRAASTHILKPPIRGLKFHNENELLCLELARLSGNRAADAFILRIQDQTAIAVRRFDRERRGATIVRLHQEDLSQALGVNPRLKYASEGAPGIIDGVRLLRDYATPDEVYAFIRGVAFNWIIGGTDAHPRNYSVLIQGGGTVLLAPLYDLASGLLLPTKIPVDQLPFAMTIAGASTIGAISWAEWAEQARLLKLNRARVIEEIDTLLVGVLGSFDALGPVANKQQIADSFVDRFVTRIRRRAKALQGAPRPAL